MSLVLLLDAVLVFLLNAVLVDPPFGPLFTHHEDLHLSPYSDLRMGNLLRQVSVHRTLTLAWWLVP